MMHRSLPHEHPEREKGSIVIIALVLLLLVTLLGITITRITSLEMHVAANERDYARAFYAAEAAVMEAMQHLENAAPQNLNPGGAGLKWLHDGDTNLEDLDIIKNPALSAPSACAPHTRFAAKALGVTGGGSLAMTDSGRLRSFEVHGFSGQRGRARIVAGYKRRF